MEVKEEAVINSSADTGTGQRGTQAWCLRSSRTNLVISEVLRQDGQTVGVRWKREKAGKL